MAAVLLLPVPLLMLLRVSAQESASFVLFALLGFELLLGDSVLLIARMRFLLRWAVLRVGGLRRGACFALFNPGPLQKTPYVQRLLRIRDSFFRRTVEDLRDAAQREGQASIVLLQRRAFVLNERHDIAPLQIAGRRVMKNLLQCENVFVVQICFLHGIVVLLSGAE